jgi:glycosyltransferase involved in cell wall biosynthesis
VSAPEGRVLIGIDASRAARPRRTGTEAYAWEVIAALLRRPEDDRYRLYLDRPPGPDFPTSDRAEPRVIPSPRLWTHWRLAEELARRRPELLFVPSHVIPWRCPVPAVATVHDVGYLWHRTAYSPLAWLLLHLGTLQNVRAARRLVVDSQATARDLGAHFGVAPERMRVAYLGGPAPREVAIDVSVLARAGLDRPYFLFVGTLQPRKNLPRVIQAFARLRGKSDGGSGPLLALAGAAGRSVPALRSLVARLGIADRVRWLDYVPSADLPTLYAASAAFVFPSHYEGFGLPALEAMAWGAPVVTASTSSLPEVVGDAGLLVDPYDVAGLSAAMGRLLDDSSLRERLIAAGRARAAGFTWDRCAATIRATLTEALAG